MLIGEDFEKIKLHLFGLDLLEPNAFIGDVVILAVALFCANKTNQLKSHGMFFVYWRWFFLVFGFGFIFGGLGHLFYNYTGVPGKYLSWYSGIVSSYLIEMAFVSVFPYQNWIQKLKVIALVKMIAVFVIASYVFYTTDLTVDHKKGLMVPTTNSIVGMGLTLGVLGFYYSKKIDKSFLIFFISIFILVPSAIFQSLKINFHQWFDRNDVSHVLIIASAIMYFMGIKAYHKYLVLKQD